MSAGKGRADVPPTTWEMPAAAAMTWLVAAAALLPGGRGAAALVFGGGWVWPAGSDALLDSIGGLFTGDVGAGLSAGDAALLPGAAAVYAVIGGGVLLLISVTAWAGLLWRRNFGSGSRTGMADRAEVEAVLGLGRLRKVRGVICPDLYPRRRAGSTPPPEGVLS